MPDITLDLTNCNKTQIALLLGVDVRTVDLYIKLPVDPLPGYAKGSLGKYYLWEEVREWLIRRKTKKATGKADKFKPSELLADSKLVGQNLINEKAQLELEVRKGELLEATDVEKTWSDALVTIKQSLLNVGHGCAIDIVDSMSYAKKKALIDAAIFAGLETVIAETEVKTDVIS